MDGIRAGVTTSLMLAAALAAAQGGAPADSARASMRAGNYAEAYCVWRELATRGDAEAQYSLGWMYHNGYGLAINDVEALRWWEKAAAQEYADALYALGALYRAGSLDVPKDGPRAVGYFVRAAQKGDDDAAALLRSLIARNDPAVRDRRAELLKQHHAALGARVTVKVDKAAFRQSADAGSPALAVFTRGKALVELARRSGWLQAGDPDDGRVGWIKATLVETAAEK